ncbi:MAG: RHS repeat domain-containing protein [Actinomycetes bacterium]
MPRTPGTGGSGRGGGGRISGDPRALDGAADEMRRATDRIGPDHADYRLRRRQLVTAPSDLPVALADASAGLEDVVAGLQRAHAGMTGFAAGLRAIDHGVGRFGRRFWEANGVTPPVSPDYPFGRSGAGPHADSRTAAAGDPVDTATGALWRTDTEVALVVPGGAGLVGVARTWSSAWPEVGVFGRGWTSLLDVRLLELGDAVGDGTRRRLLVTEDGCWLALPVDAPADLPGVTTRLETAGDPSRSGGGVEAVRADGVRYRFDGDGRCTALVWPDGGLVRLGARGLRRWIDAGGGRRIDVVLDDEGRAVEVVDGAGRRFGYRYDGDLLVAVEHPDRTVRYGHDADGRITTVHRDDLLLLETWYRADGRVDRQVDAAGGAWRFAWADEAETCTVTDPAGAVRVDRYAGGELAGTVDGLGREHAVARAAAGAPDGVPAAPVDGAALLAEALGVEVERDAADRVVAVRRVDDAGVVATVDVEHHDTGARAVLAAGGVTAGVVDLDARGLVRAVRVEGRAAVAVEHDALDRPVRLALAATGPRAAAGETVTYAWSADGRLAARTSSLGELIATHDAGGRVTAIGLPDGRRRTFRWDAQDRLVGWGTADGDVDVVLDGDGRAVGLAGALDVEVGRDDDGRVARVVDAAGELRVARDDAGRPVELARDGVPTVRLGTTAAGAVRAEVEGAAGGIDLTPAPAGDPAAGAAVLDGPGGAVTTAPGDGDRTTVTTAGPLTTTEVRDERGLLVRREVRAGGRVLLAEDVTHDAAGAVATWTRRGDAATAGAAAGAGTADRELRWETELDGAGRLVGVRSSDGRAWRWELDAAGRRTAEVVRDAAGAEAVTRFELDAAGRPAAVVAADGTRAGLVLDGEGRVADDGTFRHRYDALGGLVEVAAHDGSARVSHTLDGAGLRVRSVVERDGSVVRDLRWVWDRGHEVPRVLAVRDEVSGRLELVRWTVDGRVAGVVDAAAPARSWWFVTDRIGTVTAVCDAAGGLVEVREHDPFGVRLDGGGSGDGGPLVSFGFAGGLVDEVTGHLHLLARQYVAGWGRFASPDPVQPPVGVMPHDPWLYADHRPLDLVDPDGRWPRWVEDAASWVGQKQAEFNEWYDENETWLDPVLAGGALVVGVVATALAAPAVVTGAAVAGAVFAAYSMVDNVSEGNWLGAAADAAGVVTGGLGAAGRLAGTVGGAVDDVALTAVDDALIGWIVGSTQVAGTFALEAAGAPARCPAP